MLSHVVLMLFIEVCVVRSVAMLFIEVCLVRSVFLLNDYEFFLIRIGLEGSLHSLT